MCIHMQTKKHIIILNFGPSFMTSSLLPVKTLSMCRLAVFVDKGGLFLSEKLRWKYMIFQGFIVDSCYIICKIRL